ncbi:MAG: PIG-L deacetylase family protein [Sideroxyarcus sp.]|nr:PIG-L deacetylase family protein [Sideroxyarcus sp.]
MRVLVIAAHPDDEVLGCGGTIAKHSRNGDEVHVMIMAEGLTSRDNGIGSGKDELSKLASAARKANEILGVASLSMHGLPDNRLDSIDRLDVIKLIEYKISDYKPECVYTHHAGDVNIDHRIIHEAVNAACRPVPGHSVKRLLYFEIPSSTEWQIPGSAPSFLPTWFVDVSGTLGIKLGALKVYETEKRNWPHPRSYQAVEYLAKWRGATVGVEAAECFVLGRMINI